MIAIPPTHNSASVLTAATPSGRKQISGGRTFALGPASDGPDLCEELMTETRPRPGVTMEMPKHLPLFVGLFGFHGADRQAVQGSLVAEETPPPLRRHDAALHPSLVTQWEKLCR